MLYKVLLHQLTHQITPRTTTYTTFGQLAAQPVAGFSTEYVQRIAIAMIALVGCPSTGGNYITPYYQAHYKSLLTYRWYAICLLCRTT